MKVFVGNITHGTDLQELRNLAFEYTHLNIDFGVMVGSDKFRGTDQQLILEELSAYRLEYKYQTALYLDGESARTPLNETEYFLSLSRAERKKKPNKVFIKPGSEPDYSLIEYARKLRVYRVGCYLINSPETNGFLEGFIQKYGREVLASGIRFNHCPGRFNHGWQAMIHPYGRGMNEGYFGGGITMDNAGEALDWISHRFGDGAANISVVEGVMTDGKTDLAKTSGLFKNVADWKGRQQ